MLAHMTDKSEEMKYAGQASKVKLNIFHEAFCKKRIDQEGLIRIT